MFFDCACGRARGGGSVGAVAEPVDDGQKRPARPIRDDVFVSGHELVSEGACCRRPIDERRLRIG